MPEKKEPGPQRRSPVPKKSDPGPANAPKSPRDPSKGERMTDPSGLLPARFQPAYSRGAHQAGPNRDAPGARVARTGWTHLNVEATRLVLESAGFPSDFASMGVYLGADTTLKEVAGRLVKGAFQGLTPMRYIERNRTMVLYLHNIFSDYPQLRPSSENWVAVSPRTEAGTTFFVIQLGLGLRRRRGSRGEGSETA